MRSLVALSLISLASCAQAAPAEERAQQRADRQAQPPVQGYSLVRAYPHDPDAFTQGLIFLDGHLYESTGLVGQSTLRKVQLDTGKVVKSVSIPTGLFGEGIVNWGDQILSVTWQNGVGFRWDRASFRQLGRFSYPGEGWGLTQNGRDIILSDGTPTLRFFDPQTMRERRRLTVTAGGVPVPNLNELEYVDGEILANVWMTSRIARIDPASGKVTSWIELAPLVAEHASTNTDKVLNGIAWDASARRLFVTGKNWDKLYEIALVGPLRR
jgi:glutamine cyclotransferase